MATTDMSANLNNSTTDGMGFEEVNQEVTGTAIVSGTDIYGTTSVTAPQVSGTNIYASTLVTAPEVSGTNVYSTSGIQAIWYSGTMVRATDTVESDTISGGDIRDAFGTLESVAIGSTATQIYGGHINAGSGTLSADSGLAVTFGATFTAQPHVLCSYIDEPSSVGVVVGSNISITGFEAIGDTASKDFSWIAVGV